MIDRNLTNLSFQTFFVSREQSSCPLISEIVRIGRNLKERDLLKGTTGVISLGFGKRLLINGNRKELGNLKREDFLEVVDYDPVKKIVLAIGKTDPCIETSAHWLIHHARADVNAIIQLNGEEIIKRLIQELPSTEKEFPPGSLDLTKEILKTLRESKSIVIKNAGLLFVGVNLKEVEDVVLRTLGKRP
jgi:hypothetical protein